MILNRPGKFKADIIESGVAETGNPPKCTWIARFNVTEEQDADGEWQTIAEEQITGYFYMQYNDGNINERTINEIRSATGWADTDPLWLQDNVHGLPRVQLLVIAEEFNGKMRTKVARIASEHGELEQGVKRTEGAARSALQAKLGSKLRAISGGVPVTTPVPPRPPATPAVTASTMQEAWAWFWTVCPKNTDNEWLRITGILFPGRDIEKLSASDWQRFVDEAQAHVVPF